MEVNKVVYNGGTLLDLTSDTVTPQTLLSGTTAHAANGQSISGTVDLNGKADKVANATAGNFAGLDASGNLTDSGKSASDFDNVWLGTRAEHTAAETAGTLPETAIIGITDESGGGGGGGSDVIDDEHVSTETTYSSEKIESLFELPTKTFGACSEDELVSIISKADAGELNPSNYWAVGDERTVSLSAMGTSTGIDETHAAQAARLVIYHAGLYSDKNGKTVNFIVGLKDSLAETGKMNITNTNAGSWDSCPRRRWCNSVFYNAIPSTIRAIFKQFKAVTATEKDSATTTISIDYFSLPAEKEVFGEKKYSTQQEANELTQFDYFKVSANRIKKVNGANSYWWFRSPYIGSSMEFCHANGDGSANYNPASRDWGLSPFGCI